MLSLLLERLGSTMSYDYERIVVSMQVSWNTLNFPWENKHLTNDSGFMKLNIILTLRRNDIINTQNNIDNTTFRTQR